MEDENRTDGELVQGLLRVAGICLFDEDRRILIEASNRIARVKKKKKKLAVTRFFDSSHLLDFVNVHFQPEDVMSINVVNVTGRQYFYLWYWEVEQ